MRNVYNLLLHMNSKLSNYPLIKLLNRIDDIVLLIKPKEIVSNDLTIHKAFRKSLRKTTPPNCNTMLNNTEQCDLP